MKTTLESMLKTCLNTKLEIERFKAQHSTLMPVIPSDFENFLQEISNTLLSLHDKVVELKMELEK